MRAPPLRGPVARGSRWNSPGCAVVYTSENHATAALEILVHIIEILVHIKRAHLLRDDYVIFELDVPDALVATLDPHALPEGWDAPIETTASTDIGDAWWDAGERVTLSVPIVVRGEMNLLLNPEHRDFDQIVIRPPERFLFDERLGQ